MWGILLRIVSELDKEYARFRMCSLKDWEDY